MAIISTKTTSNGTKMTYHSNGTVTASKPSSTTKTTSSTPTKTTSTSSSSKTSSSSGGGSSSSIARTVSGGSNPTGLTTAQVKAIQKSAGIAQDGIIGPQTQKVLNAQKTTTTTTSTGTQENKTIAKTVSGGSNPQGLTVASVKLIQKANGVTADGIIGPVTQALLNKGATATKPKVTTTTAPAPAPITTPTTKAPAGTTTWESTTGNLNIGSTGNDVKAIQSYLKANGYTSLAVDGIYGPQTQAAVKSFQAANGLTPDGIAGPLTKATITKFQTTDAPIVVPPDTSLPPEPEPTDIPIDFAPTGDPTQDALLKELQTYIKTQQDAGLAINPNLVFSQATLDKFLETAKKSVHPYYQQQIDTIRQDVLQAAPLILDEYNRQMEDQAAKFKQNLGSAREDYSGAGLAFSGQRAGGELGMQAAQNRNLEALQQGTSSDFYKLGRAAEEQIGAGNVNYTLPSLAKYRTDLAGVGSTNQFGINTPYTKGGYQLGKIPMAEQAAAEERNQALKKTASEAVVAGRSYQDLFQ